MSGHSEGDHKEETLIIQHDVAVERSPQVNNATPAVATMKSSSSTSVKPSTTVAVVVASSSTMTPPSDQKATPNVEIDRESTSHISATAAATSTGAAIAVQESYITEPGPEDVLLGRGAPIINYVGNVKFRNLVRSRKNDYITSGRHKIKDKVARSILREIQRRGGRFLKRVEVPQSDVAAAEEDRSNLSSSNDSSPSPCKDVKVYQIADYDVALEKVKQALRDKDTDVAQYLSPGQQQQQSSRNKEAPVESVGLEEVAAASGISTLTALEQQLYSSQRRRAQSMDLPEIIGSTNNGNMMSLSTSTLHSAPPENHHLSTINEFIRYQQLQSLPLKMQERLVEAEKLRLQESQIQGQQRLLARFRADTIKSNPKDIPNFESVSQSNLPITMTSLLQLANNQSFRNAERGNNHINLERYLLQTQSNPHHANTSLSTHGGNSTRNISTNDLLIQHLLMTNPSSHSATTASPASFNNNHQDHRLSQIAANFVSQQQLQYDQQQYQAALLAHALSLNQTAAQPGIRNNISLASTIHRSALLDNATISNSILGTSSLMTNALGLAPSSSRTDTRVQPPILPSLTTTGGEKIDSQDVLDKNIATNSSIEAKKRPSDPNNQHSSHSNTNTAQKFDTKESTQHKKKSKLE